MTSNNAHKRKLNRARGFSLLEVLLTVGVTATFLIFVVGIGQEIAERQANRAAANYVQQLNKAVQVLLSDPDRFLFVHNAVGGAVLRQASVSDLVNGTGVLAGIPGFARNPALSDAFPTVAPLKQTYDIVFRVADDPADPNDSEALEVFILSETKLPDTQATDIAGLLSGQGGALRDSPDAAVADIRGIYGSWIVPMTDLSGTAWHATVTGATPPTLQNGSYVISYNYWDINRVAKDYLYRTNTGDPELNTMRSDLSLGGYNLIGADDMNVTGSLAADQVFVKGRARLQGATAITGTLQADGPSTAGTITSSGPLQVSVTGGSLESVNTTAVQGGFQSLESTTMNSTGKLTAENAQTGPGATLRVTSPSGVFATADGFAVAGTTTVANQLKASSLSAQNLNVQTGNTASIFMQTTGDFSQTSGTVQMNRLSVSGTAKAGGGTNWTCGSGC